MDANVTPFILKDGKRLITLTTLHFGPEEKIIAKIDNKESFSFTMPDGIKTFDIPVTLSQTGGNIQLTVTSGKKNFCARLYRQALLFHGLYISFIILILM